MMTFYCENCNRETIKPICSYCGSTSKSTGYDEKEWISLSETEKNRIRYNLSVGKRNGEIIAMLEEIIKSKELMDRGIVTKKDFDDVKRNRIAKIREVI